MKNYILIVLLALFANSVFAQIEVSQFNAAWNKNNEVAWVGDLSDCETISYVDIGTQAEMAKKHKIAVVPTVIIFKDGEEVARFQANIMMQLETPKKDVQEAIDEILMEDF